MSAFTPGIVPLSPTTEEAVGVQTTWKSTDHIFSPTSSKRVSHQYCIHSSLILCATCHKTFPHRHFLGFIYFTPSLLPFPCLAQQECSSPQFWIRIFITHQNVKNFDLKHPAGNSVLTNSGQASCICEEKQHSNEKHATEEKRSAAEEGQKRLGGCQHQHG